MSTYYLRFRVPQNLIDAIQYLRPFVIGNVRQTLIEAGVYFLQVVHEMASRGLIKCVAVLFHFSFTDASLVRKARSVWPSVMGNTPVRGIG